MISIEDYFGLNAYNDELHRSADNLLLKVNSLLQELGIEKATMTSGYRSPEYNIRIGGAPNSKHCLAEAIDLADNDRVLGNRLKFNPVSLMNRGMAMENLEYCETKRGTKWVHLQVGLPKSGKTIFIPYAGPPKKL